jgi:asparagine synthase (glutamine-hydrolysing)
MLENAEIEVIYKMNNLFLNLRDNLWMRFDNTYAIGSAFLNKNLLRNYGIAKIFSTIDTWNDFIATLEQLNGFFAVIHEKNGETFFAVDHIRSIPLFYCIDQGRIYISDNACWIRSQINDKDIDDNSAFEFLLTGYVTGNDTLYNKIKQLQAGEALNIALNQGRADILSVRYYRYFLQYSFNKSQKELLAELDHVLVKAFRRFIDWADGRKIVVPLSAGHDSRLIILMLKRLGYNNISAFTYGKPGNKQSEISKEIADYFSVRWDFVPYDEEAWNQWYHSKEWKKYCNYAFNLCSVPHIQDWPAVWQLKLEGLIPKNCVIVPGHTVVPAYNEWPRAILDKDEIDERALIDSIYKDHFRLWNWSSQMEKCRPKFEKKNKKYYWKCSEISTRNSCNGIRTMGTRRKAGEIYY